MQTAVGILLTQIVGHKPTIRETLTSERWLAEIASHDHIATTSYAAVIGDAHVSVLHRATKTARITQTVVEVMGAHDTRLGGCIGVEKTGGRQRGAECLQGWLADGRSPCLNEVNAVGKSSQP